MSEGALFADGAAIRRMYRASDRDAPVDWRLHVARLAGWCLGPVARLRLRMAVGTFARRVARERGRLRSFDQQALADAIRAERGAITLQDWASPAGVRTTALAAELSRHTLGLDPFPAQVRGVGVLLSGSVAEMPTGSGKTLTAALAAITAVYAGQNVHVITANDYLAERDVTELAPLFEAAGVSAGLIVHSVPQRERPAAYRRDVVYCSNKEVAFDYLRNRIALGSEAGPVRTTLEPLHRRDARANLVTMTGLPFAIVDEADSVLIDECRTPLIISANAEPDTETADVALHLGDALIEGSDYTLDDKQRIVTFTEKGRKRLSEMGNELGGIWRNNVRREAAARQGIVARAFFRRDEHYVVQEGKVALIDEYTGRIAADRQLSDGLHQVIEAKEGVPVTGRRFTQGRITFQRFFRRYGRLSGMTGTAREVAGELLAVYRLHVLTLRPHHRRRRRYLGVRICRTEAKKWARLARRTRRMVARQRPVLIATRTILASNAASEALTEAGIEHVVLNATQDAEEGGIIAEAGQPGRVTVATNMAGRGVDIRLGDGVEAAGGLHVILTELHEAGRIDRQAYGRTARQGDRGSYEILLSWEDPLISIFGDWRSRLRLGGVFAFWRAQRRAEKLHARARYDLLRHDGKRDQQLTFTGSVE